MADSVPFAWVRSSDSGDAESVTVSPIDVFFDPTSGVSPGTLRATKVKSDMFSNCCPWFQARVAGCGAAFLYLLGVRTPFLCFLPGKAQSVSSSECIDHLSRQRPIF
jgi:hypothetical protein